MPDKTEKICALITLILDLFSDEPATIVALARALEAIHTLIHRGMFYSGDPADYGNLLVKCVEAFLAKIKTKTQKPEDLSIVQEGLSAIIQTAFDDPDADLSIDLNIAHLTIKH